MKKSKKLKKKMNWNFLKQFWKSNFTINIRNIFLPKWHLLFLNFFQYEKLCVSNLFMIRFGHSCIRSSSFAFKFSKQSRSFSTLTKPFFNIIKKQQTRFGVPMSYGEDSNIHKSGLFCFCFCYLDFVVGNCRRKKKKNFKSNENAIFQSEMEKIARNDWNWPNQSIKLNDVDPFRFFFLRNLIVFSSGRKNLDIPEELENSFERENILLKWSLYWKFFHW